MARKKASRRGGTWSGLFFGIVLGVAAAVGVALYVTKVPMPFKDKASRSIPSTLLPDANHAPDPNIALYGSDGPAGTRSAAQGGSSENPPAPAPEPGTQAPDAIGQLIAGINKPATAPTHAEAPASKPTTVALAKPSLLPPPPAPPAPVHRSAPEKPAASLPSPAPHAAPRPAPGTRTTYYLQTGAFRSRNEADAMLARVVLLGLPVHVEPGEANGAPINRVRVGPFKGIDDMNRARTKLGDDKIESTVVRP